MLRRGLWPLVATVVLARAPAAVAGPEPTADALAAAQAAFRVGAEAFRANKFAVAARAFEQAYEIDPRPETAFSIAQGNRLAYYIDRVGWRVQRAVDLYQTYLARLQSGPRAHDAIDRLQELEPLLRELRQRGEIRPYDPPALTQIVVGAEAAQARVTVDGKAAQLWDVVDVEPGDHEIVVDARGFQLERRHVVAAAGRFLALDVELHDKPGWLRMRAEPGSRLFVDGRQVADLPSRDLPIAPGEHFISLTTRGRESFDRTIAIARDTPLEIDATLVPTAQRRAAHWVFASSAVIAGAAGSAARWGYAARRDADRLDAKRRDLSATPADLAAYNARVDDVRVRTDLAVGLAGTSLAAAAVGFGLWWFDRPQPGAVPTLVQPVIGRDRIGLDVSARF